MSHNFFVSYKIQGVEQSKLGKGKLHLGLKNGQNQGKYQ